jgi:phosphotriesterase-related protein
VGRELEEIALQVESVLGPIDTNRLGVTLMHEHVFVLSPEIESNWPSSWNEEARVADAIRRLKEVKAHGIDTIVDLTVIGLGRDVPRVRRIAEAACIQVLVATGLYTYNEVPHFFQYRGPDRLLGGLDPMVDMFVADIEVGIAGTSVKAAMLKCAVDAQGLTPGVERVLRTVSEAHRRTGAPITVHTHAPSRGGLEVQRVLREEGVDLSRTVMGHSGDTADMGYLEQLVSAGSYVGMDRFGIDVFLPFEARVRSVAALCRRGYADRVVLSHDYACFNDWLQPEQAVADLLPNWSYLHITDDVLPALRDAGVSDDEIRVMLVDNPRRIFEHGEGY